VETPFSLSGFKSFAVESIQENLTAFLFGDVAWNSRPDKLAGGVSHAAADDEAFGSGLFHHLPEKVVVQIRRGVSY